MTSRQDPCPGQQVLEAGYCADYGPGGDGCISTSECAAGFLCRGFDAPACVCDPRPGIGDACAVPCVSDADCDTSFGMVCDPLAGVCRSRPLCMTDGDCPSDEACMDHVRLFFYVTGVGLLWFAEDARDCGVPGDLPEEALCVASSACASAACADPLDSGDKRCGIGCIRNADCREGRVCAQGSWGPPICVDAPANCPDRGLPDQLCRLGGWVTSCVSAADCHEGDCQFPDSTSAANDYGGVGFGVGQCTEHRQCMDDEFRSQWVDRWVAPTCFSQRACWQDLSCLPGEACLPVDALAMTLRCGRRL